MDGLHLTADLYHCQCDAALLLDAQQLAQLCTTQTHAAGLTLVDDCWVKFPDYQGQPGGVTGVVLLAESHLAIHTWPETGNVTLDVYVCNFSDDNSGKARQLLESVIAAFQPERIQRQHLQRGDISAAGSAAEQWVREELTSNSAYSFRAEVIKRKQTPFQKLELLQSPVFGRMLRLDERFMTSEKEEFFYHEAMVHPAAMAHPAPKRALIIGGGDGGAAEELLKHSTIERVVLAELDAQVVETARKHLQKIHRGAFDDPRLQVRIGDGLQLLAETDERFDLVLMDLTDPDTPAETLYTPEALQRIKRVLAPGGAVVQHLGSPVFHAKQVQQLAECLRREFAQVQCYGLYIPLYGAYWGLAVASDSLQPALLTPALAAQRLAERGVGDLQFYNAELHPALFALPTYYRELVAAQPAGKKALIPDLALQA